MKLETLMFPFSLLMLVASCGHAVRPGSAFVSSNNATAVSTTTCDDMQARIGGKNVAMFGDSQGICREIGGELFLVFEANDDLEITYSNDDPLNILVNFSKNLTFKGANLNQVQFIQKPDTNSLITFLGENSFQSTTMILNRGRLVTNKAEQLELIDVLIEGKFEGSLPELSGISGRLLLQTYHYDAKEPKESFLAEVEGDCSVAKVPFFREYQASCIRVLPDNTWKIEVQLPAGAHTLPANFTSPYALALTARSSDDNVTLTVPDRYQWRSGTLSVRTLSKIHIGNNVSLRAVNWEAGSFTVGSNFNGEEVHFWGRNRDLESPVLTVGKNAKVVDSIFEEFTKFSVAADSTFSGVKFVNIDTLRFESGAHFDMLEDPEALQKNCIFEGINNLEVISQVQPRGLRFVDVDNAVLSRKWKGLKTEALDLSGLTTASYR